MQEKFQTAETFFEAAVTFEPQSILAWTMFGSLFMLLCIQHDVSGIRRKWSTGATPFRLVFDGASRKDGASCLCSMLRFISYAGGVERKA